MEFYMSINFYIDETSLNHDREVYGVFDVFGEYGGVQGVLIFIFSFLFAPLSKHQFILRAIQKLYMGKLGDKNFFSGKKPNQT